MAYQQILFAQDGPVLTITLNRPERLNAFTADMMAELMDAFDRADEDDAIRAVVMTGAGRAFCAGADLSGGAETFNRNTERPADTAHRESGGILALRIFDCKEPVIAAFNGPAIGIGLTMTLPMDIRLAADTASFGLVFTRVGIVPEACSSWFLPRIVGIGKALSWVQSGRIFDAAEAQASGLVEAVHSPSDLLPAAHAMARDIAAHTSGLSVALSRQLLWKMLTADHPMAANQAESRILADIAGKADAREGVQAFLDKRPPRFSLGATSRDLPDFYPWWPPRRFED